MLTCRVKERQNSRCKREKMIRYPRPSLSMWARGVIPYLTSSRMWDTSPASGDVVSMGVPPSVFSQRKHVL